MKLLIVAKTKVGSDVCIGSLDEHGVSIRLKEADESFPSLSTYSVGELWDVTGKKPKTIVPPHVETILVTARTKLGTETKLLKAIKRLVKVPWTGDITALYEGKLGFTGNCHGYVQAPDIPSKSTWFWVPDADLTLANGYYRYGDGPYEVKYVGVEAAIPKIPAGTLVRVSLAGWWKPRDADDNFPERCYLQLSGWYV